MDTRNVVIAISAMTLLTAFGTAHAAGCARLDCKTRSSPSRICCEKQRFIGKSLTPFPQQVTVTDRVNDAVFNGRETISVFPRALDA
ncbi:MAG: hypothetical protein QOF74_7816 [Caballeronia mineralivorans]|jgi:hypothetical protein|nr:hypothetical protein [Caballeronia mineralivorans]